MFSNEDHFQQGHGARRGSYSIAGIALFLIIAACGSEAENTDTAKTQQSATEETQQSAGETAQANNDTTASDAAAESGGMVADAGEAADDGSEEAAAEEKKQEREPMDGYTVYNRFCTTCHRTGLNAAPKHRDKKAWAPRIAKGKETLYKHSIEGFKGMPAKGGIAGLYDQEVKDAVDFMVEQAGGWDAGE